MCTLSQIPAGARTTQHWYPAAGGYEYEVLAYYVDGKYHSMKETGVLRSIVDQTMTTWSEVFKALRQQILEVEAGREAEDLMLRLQS